VRDKVNGRVLWEGNVEVFALLGHDEALRCYARGHTGPSGRWEVTTGPAIPPVVSAATAVVAAFAVSVKTREQGWNCGR
jgi:hypothetical protein